MDKHEYARIFAMQSKAKHKDNKTKTNNINKYKSNTNSNNTGATNNSDTNNTTDNNTNSNTSVNTMSDLIIDIIRTTSTSFDFALVISINIVSYIVINIVNGIIGRDINKWKKRVITCISAVVLSIIYHNIDACEPRLILNSAILAPVFWSWIGKPILHKLNADYNDFIND